MSIRGALHHVELWVVDLERAEKSWTWLLGELGYALTDTWSTGRRWTLGETYIVLESGPDVRAVSHDRCRPGLNHLAFWAGDRPQVDALTAGSLNHGWRLLFADRHPHAGGPEHYAAYLEDSDGFEIELVAD